MAEAKMSGSPPWSHDVRPRHHSYSVFIPSYVVFALGKFPGIDFRRGERLLNAIVIPPGEHQYKVLSSGTRLWGDRNGCGEIPASQLSYRIFLSSGAGLIATCS